MSILPILFSSTSGNNYLYSPKKNQILLIHPIIQHLINLRNSGSNIKTWINNLANKSVFIEGNMFTEKEIRYYYRKFKFLENNNYFNVHNNKNRIGGRLNGNSIKLLLAKTMQITFEVTDKCNLKCYYCAYGDLYEGYDKRQNKNLDINSAVNLIEYLLDLKLSFFKNIKGRKIAVGFYGGEPLLNFQFIKDIVRFMKKSKTLEKYFSYTITTNGVLLNKYQNFLVENDFKITISLDGNFQNNGYRTFPNGDPSFWKVYQNANALKEKYPNFFKTNVNFNSVLHNKNSTVEIYSFFKNSFAKIPRISIISPMGLNVKSAKDLIGFYKKFYNRTRDPINKRMLEKDIFINLPEVRSLVNLIHNYSGYTYKNYCDLVGGRGNGNVIPTGTCLPFQRKIYLTVNGKVLPCERISHVFSLGYVTGNSINIEFDHIAKKYNNYYEKLKNQCENCYHVMGCKQCIFYLNIEEENPICKEYKNHQIFSKKIRKDLSLLETRPDFYYRIINEAIFL